MTEPPRIDLLFQYALACASQADDWRHRSLAALHLLKYAYLADLAHAARNQGATYTGVGWQFLHFGPWDGDAHDRVQPALVDRARADERHYSSRGADHVSYLFKDSWQANRVAETADSELPPRVAMAIARSVRRYGNDTADLLRHVYLTPPMLAARPGEVLDFETAILPVEPPAEPQPRVRLTRAEKRRRAKVLEEGRRKMRQLIDAERTSRVVPAGPPPRYDEVFHEGTEALDRQAGPPPKPSSGTIYFDDSVWSSSQRRDPDIP
ncbi:MAG: hypothetical protein OXG13_08415 [Gemmatimonadaceae bacterium]|nr:hypothetical protein [Gemmatimonadaceae bacterium]